MSEQKQFTHSSKLIARGSAFQYFGTFSSTRRDQASMPPRMDCDLFESLLPQPYGHIHRAHTVMAHDDDVIFRIEFLMRSRWYVAHGDQLGSRHLRGLEFPRLADIEQRERLARCPSFPSLLRR